MDKLVEIRSQEFLCRERAAFDSERKAFWLAQAEEWEQAARAGRDRVSLPGMQFGSRGRPLDQAIGRFVFHSSK